MPQITNELPHHRRQPGPVGPANELHLAAMCGSSERTVVALWRGSIDIDQGDTKGYTPLMTAATKGCPAVVRILLDKGAKVSIVTADGFTALYMCAKQGNPVVVDMLLKAGSDVEARTLKGFTPLHGAAGQGHLEAMRVLIDAGANPNTGADDGTAPLHSAAWSGHVGAVKALLRAKADPLAYTSADFMGRTSCTPLDIAAGRGHSDVVREMLRQVGGVDSFRREIALRVAARMQCVDVIAMLLDAGELDTDMALMEAIDCGSVASVKLLLLRRENRHEGKVAAAAAAAAAAGGRSSYVNTARDRVGRTPLLRSVTFCRRSSTRMLRLLVDAGADTTSVLRLSNFRAGAVVFNDTPLSLVMRYIREKKVPGGKVATEEELQMLESIYRLLSRVDAVRATSWLWPRDVPPVGRVAQVGSKTKAAPAMMRLLTTMIARKQKAGWRGVALAPMLGFSRKA